ncbi:MAG TPA: cbb3-type cytochrome c oxidase subunit I, partial [Candidatus Acidoferrales bacterium]|nr:cbb3-type cytochrome c oxidase subunit I [Candidatus Acidoferrales bacterium]
GGIYGLLPRLTHREPSLMLVGAHFWLSLIGVLIYGASLTISGTQQGMVWLDNRPFIESVIVQAPYWLWRSVGGTLMVLGHVIFAYNLYLMRRREPAEAAS